MRARDADLQRLDKFDGVTKSLGFLANIVLCLQREVVIK